LLAAVVALALCGCLVLASSAFAANYTWAGAAPAGEPNWSDGTNWDGGTAPSGTVGTLTFPSPPNSMCEGLSILDTCGNTNNNISGLGVNGLAFPDPSGAPAGYALAGEALTLGSGGIAADVAVGDLQGEATFSLPITLGAKQTWSLAQWRLVLNRNVTGPAAELGVKLGFRGELTVNSNVEAGPITVTGAGGRFALEIQNGGLNATDGHSVSLVGTELFVPSLFYRRTTTASTGPLTLTGESSITLDEPLAVSGAAKFDEGGDLNVGVSAQTPDSMLTATGNVNLANAGLSLHDYSCNAALAPGEVRTLVTTAGSLTGTFKGVPNGSFLEVASGGDGCLPDPPVRITYTPHSVTATGVDLEPYGGAFTFGELAAGGHNPSEFCLICFMGKLISFFRPVDAPTGNFWHTFDDLSVPGRGIPLDLTRTYNSDAATTDGPFGFGWSFPYDMSLSFPDATHVVVDQENGSQVTFTEQSGGTYTAPPRVTATLVHNGDGSWTFVRRHRDTFSVTVQPLRQGVGMGAGFAGVV
jgi:Domain of unknown function (DUF6531)